MDVWVGCYLHGDVSLYYVQGALTAALAVCDVDAKHAVRVATRLLQEAGVWERPLGLIGVSGQIKERKAKLREKKNTHRQAFRATIILGSLSHVLYVQSTLPRADELMSCFPFSTCGVGVGWGGACVAGRALAFSRPHYMQPQGACDRAAAVAVDPDARARVCG